MKLSDYVIAPYVGGAFLFTDGYFFIAYFVC